MAQNNDYLWNILNGKLPAQAFNQFKGVYQQRQAEIRPPAQIGMAPNPGPYGDMFRGALDAQDKLKGFTTEQIEAAKGYKPETPKIDDSNILYNLPMFNNKPAKAPNPMGGLLGGLGAIGTTVANTGSPSVGLGALSGAATGAGYGMMLGPVGAGVGAVIGGLTGFVGSGLKKAAYEDQRQEAQKGKIKAATVYGGDIGEFEGGGNVGGDPNELTPIQTERNEQIVMPSFQIFKSKSTETHKQMDKGYVTDLLPPDAFVASAAKRMQISRDKADKMILGYDAIEYTEEGNTSKPTENKLSDIFSKKQMTPAELMNIIKNKFPTTTEAELDPFLRKANVANLKSRMPYVNAVIAASKK